MALEPITPERALDLYLDHRRNEVAAQTLRSHRSRLQFFSSWCHDNDINNLNELTGRKLHEYRTWRRNDGDLSKVSEKTQMATLRVFVKFLESIDAVDPDLHTKVQLPSLSKHDDVRTEMVDEETAEQLLEYLNKYHYHHSVTSSSLSPGGQRCAVARCTRSISKITIPTTSTSRPPIASRPL